MRIEEVTKVKLSKACDKELLILKLRFTQAWDRNFRNKSPFVISDITHNEFLKKYKLLLDVMGSRNIEKSTSAIDKAVFKKTMTLHKFGVDVSDLANIIIVKNCITVGAVPVPASNASQEAIDSFVKFVQPDLEEFMLQMDESIDKAYIPLYDLVLVAKQTTEIVEISKPYPNEHSARLKDPDEFDSKSFRRTKGGQIYGSKKVLSTVSIIWGKLKDKAKPSDIPIAQALRFPTKDWTLTKAKKWLSDNDIKFIEFEAAKKKTKKLLTSQKKSETEEKDKTVQKMFDKFVSVYPVDKADSEEHIVCGIVYEPDVKDSQGDFANEEEIRKAAYQFMEDVQTFKVMHKGKKVKVKILESYVAPVDFTVAKQKIKKGTWVITVRVLSKAIWKAVKDGELTGFSMAGYAKTT